MGPRPPLMDEGAINETITGLGSTSPNLVILPKMLTEGVRYTFALTARTPDSSGYALATIKVLVNRPPFGGNLRLDYEWPAVALTTKVRLNAVSWTDDDPSDFPLTYAFAYRPKTVYDNDCVIGPPRPLVECIIGWPNLPKDIMLSSASMTALVIGMPLA